MRSVRQRSSSASRRSLRSASVLRLRPAAEVGSVKLYVARKLAAILNRADGLTKFVSQHESGLVLAVEIAAEPESGDVLRRIQKDGDVGEIVADRQVAAGENRAGCDTELMLTRFAFPDPADGTGIKPRCIRNGAESCSAVVRKPSRLTCRPALHGAGTAKWTRELTQAVGGRRAQGCAGGALISLAVWLPSGEGLRCVIHSRGNQTRPNASATPEETHHETGQGLLAMTLAVSLLCAPIRSQHVLQDAPPTKKIAGDRTRDHADILTIKRTQGGLLTLRIASLADQLADGFNTPRPGRQHRAEVGDRVGHHYVSCRGIGHESRDYLAGVTWLVRNTIRAGIPDAASLRCAASPQARA